MCRSCAPQPIVTPRRRIFEDIFDIDGVRLAGSVKRGLGRRKHYWEVVDKEAAKRYWDICP
jgi:hypothetical protein